MQVARRAWTAVSLGLALVLGVAAEGWAADAVNPLASKDLSAWELKGKPEQSHWTVGTASVDPNNPKSLVAAPGGDELVNVQEHGVDIYTKQAFGDSRIELEVMVPKGSNSGIYLMGEYEIQVLDSFGRETMGMGDMGAIYGATPPKKNATREPGTWQKYVIEYTAPRFDAQGNKTENARVLSVVLNGETIQENVEMKGATPGGVTGKEAAQGPLMFQGNHGPVAYRKIRITPLEK